RAEAEGRRRLRVRAAPAAQMGHGQLGSRSGLPRIPAWTRPRSKPHLSRAGVEQGRGGAPHAAAPGRRRAVLPWAAPLLQRVAVPQGRHGGTAGRDGGGDRHVAGALLERWIYGSTLPKLKVGYRTEGADVILQ